MSLTKFAEMFKLPISKGIFPYEKYESIADIKSQIAWPTYTDFFSSLPMKQQDYLPDLKNMLLHKSIYNFTTVRNLFDFYQMSYESFADEILDNFYLADVDEKQKQMIIQHFAISPIDYFEQKTIYENKISSGQYESFLDHLCDYNLLDCELLSKALTEFINIFENCFNVSLLDKLSLPGVSEDIMWNLYDEQCPKMFSFHSEYGFLNQRIREKLLGGPTILFHRHCEIKRIGSYPESVYSVPNGSKYSKLISYDFNALYAYAMMQDLPTGLPFYFRKQAGGNFKFEIAGRKSGWSMEALDWLNHMSYNPLFLRNNGTYYLMLTAITGEYAVRYNGHSYTVDGMVRTENDIYFLEYFGCR